MFAVDSDVIACSRGGPSTRRFNDGRENPDPSRCLGVFGLSLYTTEADLRELFGKYGELDKVRYCLFSLESTWYIDIRS